MLQVFICLCFASSISSEFQLISPLIKNRFFSPYFFVDQMQHLSFQMHILIPLPPSSLSPFHFLSLTPFLSVSFSHLLSLSLSLSPLNVSCPSLTWSMMRFAASKKEDFQRKGKSWIHFLGSTYRLYRSIGHFLGWMLLILKLHSNTLVIIVYVLALCFRYDVCHKLTWNTCQDLWFTL